MKYIVFSHPTEPAFPFLFAGLTHAQVAAVWGAAGYFARTAGFVRFHHDGSVTTHDRSTSLDLDPGPHDAAFIAAFYRATLGSVGVVIPKPADDSTMRLIRQAEDRLRPFAP